MVSNMQLVGWDGENILKGEVRKNHKYDNDKNRLVKSYLETIDQNRTIAMEKQQRLIILTFMSRA